MYRNELCSVWLPRKMEEEFKEKTRLEETLTKISSFFSGTIGRSFIEKMSVSPSKIGVGPRFNKKILDPFLQILHRPFSRHLAGKDRLVLDDIEMQVTQLLKNVEIALDKILNHEYRLMQHRHGI
ncbi:uncharacterized protein LOC117924636 [Vitis riparia]|uniref:uncharacterized protein LOC117924636 n=1 Tax=Vitis riparia TaxID=96939 RepID=UPI00155ABBFB|nr:uncharacterized protein LOC117924636 [Vitis riparia]